MVILHCLTAEKWNNEKQKPFYGYDSIVKYGFIHCSSIENFWRVAPHFIDTEEKLILLCIDTENVKSEIKWEDHDNCGRKYPHIYGELNTDAVINSFPFQKDSNGEFILNKEIKKYQ